jgi:hypothetical protein
VSDEVTVQESIMLQHTGRLVQEMGDQRASCRAYAMRVVVLALVVGCRTAGGAAQDPADGPARTPSLSGEIVAGVTVTVRVRDVDLSPGDTVRFVATATNATDKRIQIGIACGPSFDVLVTLPNGTQRSVLSDLVGPNGAFICPLTPEHYVEPNSSRSLALQWVAPALRGLYTARAGLRRGDGLGNLSGSTAFVVR